MVDPVTALATASSAFSLIKRGFQAGRDIESMASDLGRWMGAMSDLDQAEKDAKNPPVFKKLFAGRYLQSSGRSSADIFCCSVNPWIYILFALFVQSKQA